jgi:hypothetical protein
MTIHANLITGDCSAGQTPTWSDTNDVVGAQDRIPIGRRMPGFGSQRSTAISTVIRTAILSTLGSIGRVPRLVVPPPLRLPASTAAAAARAARAACRRAAIH